jgi:hypothetical protein
MESKVWYYWVFDDESPDNSDGRVFFREPNEFLKYLRDLKIEAELCGAAELGMNDINKVTWYEPKSN